MNYCIVLVVFDPRDAYARACAVPAALESIESLHGDFDLVIAVNASERCPGTVALLRAWCAERAWANLRLHRENDGISAAFNCSVHDVLADYDAFVFMSADALLVDRDLLHTLSAAFMRWPHIGALHPVSIFEDADDANYSREWSTVSFSRALRRYDAASLDALDEDPFSDRIAALAEACKTRELGVTRPHLVLPLTFWAVRQSTLRAVGPMDERWRFGYENMDFALRAYGAGAESAVVQNAFVFHRRVLFRRLGSYHFTVPQTTGETDAAALWLDKWGHTPRKAWDEARYGTVVAALLEIVRRAGRHLPRWHALAGRGRAASRLLSPRFSRSEAGENDTHGEAAKYPDP